MEAVGSWCSCVRLAIQLEAASPGPVLGLEERPLSTSTALAPPKSSMFCVRRRLREVLRERVKRAEPAEVTALLIQTLWERPIQEDLSRQRSTSEERSPVGKAAGKKSSVLQQIYGGAQAKRGQPLRAVHTLSSHSQSQPLLDLSLKSAIQLSGVECVHLLDSLSQAKQYSYHLRPQSACSQINNRSKE